MECGGKRQRHTAFGSATLLTPELVAEVRPVGLLPVGRHEPNLAPIRLKKEEIVSRIGRGIGSHRLCGPLALGEAAGRGKSQIAEAEGDAASEKEPRHRCLTTCSRGKRAFGMVAYLSSPERYPSAQPTAVA